MRQQIENNFRLQTMCFFFLCNSSTTNQILPLCYTIYIMNDVDDDPLCYQRLLDLQSISTIKEKQKKQVHLPKRNRNKKNDGSSFQHQLDEEAQDNQIEISIRKSVVKSSSWSPSLSFVKRKVIYMFM